MKTKFQIIQFLILSLLLSSCTNNGNQNSFKFDSYPIDALQNNTHSTDNSYPIQTYSEAIEANENYLLPTAPNPNIGFGAVSGLLYSYTLEKIIPNTSYYLMPAIGENNDVPPIISGADPRQGDVMGFSDNDGNFSSNNVKPGFYYLVIWSPYSWCLAESDTPNETLLIEINENEKKELGVVNVPWQ